MSERLQFGNTDHIALIARADTVRIEHRRLARVKRLGRRERGVATCDLCAGLIAPGEDVARVARNLYHERCVVGRLIERRKEMRMLGYEL